MRIPRYGMYWRASGLWMVRQRGWMLIAAVFVGVPLAYTIESDLWRWAGIAGAVGAGLAIALWESR